MPSIRAQAVNRLTPTLKLAPHPPMPSLMIELTRLNHQPVVVNAVQLLTVEATPDTILTLINGDKVLVRESPWEVIELATQYYQRIGQRLTLVKSEPRTG